MPQFKTRTASPSPQQHMTLKLEHWQDDLSPAQKAYYNRAEKEYTDITTRLHELIKTHQADVIESGEDVMLVQLNGTTLNPGNSLLKNVPSIPIPSMPNQPLQPSGLPAQPVLLQAPPALCPTGPPGNLVSTVKGSAQTTQFGGSGGTIQLVMSPRLGLIVGQVPGQEGAVAATTASLAQRNAVQTVAVPTKPKPPTIVENRPPPSTPQNQAPRTLSLARVAKVSPLSQQSFLAQSIGMPTSTSTTQPKLVFSVATSTSVNTATPSQNVTVKPRIISSTSLATVASTTTTNSTKTVAATITPNMLSKTPSDKPVGAVGGPVSKGIRIASAVGAAAQVVKDPPAGSGSAPPNSGIRIASTLGGVSMSDKPGDDLQGNVAPDSREVAFNKVAGKTFPSLVVLARPHLKDKDMTPQFISKERAVLDAQVKSVLIFSPTKFTEWLIQQGLVRSEQVCPVHTGPDGKPTKLKLGMYSDVSKFPFSGGYVWISDCCPHRFVSVFSGSIFEGSPHPPSTLLKLMYHWCCQTNVQNVVHWVKVDNFYVKNFYTNMRTICTAAVHEKYERMGGKDKTIEVGVISLGTTSQGGNMRQVKVEVLGVMDPESKRIRLRAVEPLQDGERVYKRRFIKILEPLEQWVDKESIIVTDFTVDKSTLHTMGFRHVYQVSLNDAQPRNSRGNHNVMEYLRKIVPRMFQNTLSLLSRQIIQQFLDELVWRERWGPIPVEAFNNLILHLSQQTKLNSGESLLLRLARIASNPFRDWKYANWITPSGGAVPSGAVPSGAAVSSASSTSPRTPALAPLSSGSRPPVSVATTSAPSINAVSSSSDAQNAPLKKQPTRSKNAAQELQAAQQAAEEITVVGNSTSNSTSNNTSNNTSNSTSNSTNINGPPSVSNSTSSEPDNPVAVAVAEQNNLKDDSKKFDKLIPLEDYYYAFKPGDPAVISKEFKCDNINAKCCICQKIFATNIEIMQHIMAHTLTWETYKEGQDTSLEDVANRMCRYCLGMYSHPSSTIAHADEVHRHLDYRPTCLICETKFRDRQSLIAHMHRIHLKQEMPYRCGVCAYRSSEKRLIIDHFYEVHANGEELQCPFCLRCVAISKNGRKIHSNTYFFYNHVRKHQLKYLSRACSRCSLSFVHKDILKEHQLKDHNTNSNDLGVKKYSETSDAELTMMPFPPIRKSEKVSNEALLKPVPQQMPPFTSRPLGVREFDAFEDDACVECQYSLLQDNHFTSYMTCLWCRYATCCTKAMETHSQTAHSKEKKVCYPTTKVVMLPACLFCPCGFNSSNTNSLATHLGQCQFSVVYPYKHSAAEVAEIAKQAAEAAKQIDAEEEAATMPLLSISEDGDDTKVSPNVLNMLGLIPKPPEEDDEALKDEAPLLQRPELKNGRKRGRPSSISSTESRRRRRATRGLYREINDSDTESVDDVASMEGSEDSWGTDSMRSLKQRRIV